MPEQEWKCPTCGYATASDAERDRHERGVDANHLACARQDIEAIKAQQQPTSRNTFHGKAWG